MKRSLFLLLGATLYLTLSGFQCASTQMSTAKVALQGKDYKKAESSLKEELAVRPNNGEAWYLLGVEVYGPQERYAEMGDALNKALNSTEPALDSVQMKNVYIYMLQPWLDAYNAANQASQEKKFTKALEHIDLAISMRPEFAQNYSQKGVILLNSGATDQAMNAYREYVRVAGPDITRGAAKGLVLGMTQKELRAKLGEPTGKSIANSNGDFALIYPENLYVYMGMPKSGSETVVMGWKYFGSEKLPADFKSFSRPLSGYPYYRLGVEAYGQGAKNAAKYTEALELLRVVEQFDPSQADVESLIAQIYIDAGREAEARTMLDKRLKEDPKNPKVYINYSLLLYNAKDYTGATNMLQKVLDLGLEQSNASYQTALFNLGVYYKNWGKELQDSIKTVSNRPSAEQEAVYAAKLRESLKYFERLRSVQTNKGDYGLLAELGNLYYVLAQDDKLLGVIKDFEAIQNSQDMESDGQYWRELSKLYTAAGDDTKAISAGAKAKALGR